MKPAKASKRKPPVYVISGNEILTIPFDLNETTQHPDGDGTFIPDTLMVSVKCNTCRSTAVLVGQDVEESERHSHDEGMGDEIFYSGVCGGECESCHSYLEVE